MSWKIKIGLFVVALALVQALLIFDVFLNENKTIELVEVEKGKYKGKLYFRSFYVYEKQEGVYELEKFPETSFGDGLNYGKNIVGVSNWAVMEAEKLNLDTAGPIVPYDYNFLFVSFLKGHKTIVFQIAPHEDSISLVYSIQDR